MKAAQLLWIAIALLGTAARAEQAEIALPDMLAVELPRGSRALGPHDPPLREVLAAARSDTRIVTSDLRGKVGPGPVRVTFRAWDGAAGVGTPAATRTVRLFVLPAGMTPVGVSGDENATAGNNTAHIARDARGRVHMVWQDGGRPGGPTGPVYRRAAVGADGVVRFETGPIDIAEGGPSDWNAYPGLAASGETVQLVWQGGGTARTRRISLSANGWVLGPVSDTGAMSRAEDQGPAVALDTRGGVHIVTPNGVYGFSGDGGRSWKIESIPLPPAMRVKTASLAVDPLGIVHVAFTAPVTRVIRPAAGKLGQYWQLRTISRAADGKWFGTANVLEGAPGWGEPSGPDDVLADWARIAADPKGGMHLTWHGTAYSRQYAHDAAFYAWQKPGAAWRTPIALLPRNSAREGSSAPFSYAPSLALDGERALALTFYDVFDGPKVQYFDTALSAFAQGRVEKLAMPVTQFVQAAVAAKRPELAMSLRFPAAAPEVWHGPGGQTMLDVLELLQSPFEPAGANIVVYQQLNLTAMLSGKR